MAATETFQEGDTVWLKSGTSPAMTIETLKTDSAECVWFEKTKLQRATFKLSSLTKEDPNTIQLGDITLG